MRERHTERGGIERQIGRETERKKGRTRCPSCVCVVFRYTKRKRACVLVPGVLSFG